MFFKVAYLLPYQYKLSLPLSCYLISYIYIALFLLIDFLTLQFFPLILPEYIFLTSRALRSTIRSRMPYYMCKI